jgi:hypothetical protein
MLAAGAAVTGAAMVVAMAHGRRHPALVATAVAGLFAAVGGASATLARLDTAATAGILLALVVPSGGWAPVIAFRLARMRLDPTPSTPDELQSDLDPVPGQHVVDRELTTFMEAVVIVDPVDYRRYPGEPDKPMRTLNFGSHVEGLVTFLIYPPDDLVLVVQFQWLGD